MCGEKNTEKNSEFQMGINNNNNNNDRLFNLFVA